MRLITFLPVLFFVACSKEEEPTTPEAEIPSSLEAAAGNRVRLETNHGTIVIELDRDKAPDTVTNFLSYVGDGHYDGTVFHRVIGDFMIQGGGFAPDGERLAEKPTRDPIRNEASNGLRNRRGTIAMDRTSDPDSATAQFFINLKDNVGLDAPNPDGHGYAVFGNVIEGMETVDKIAKLKTDYGTLAMIHPATGKLTESNAPNVPTELVLIQSAEVLSTKAE